MTIAVELARGLWPQRGVVSHETIYQAIYAHGRRGLPAGLSGCLHRRRRHRKHRPSDPPAPTKRGPLGEFNLILARPAVADHRRQVGHLEGDLVLGSFNRSAIATVFDRASRHVWLAALRHGHGADAVHHALVNLLHEIPPELRRTITWDQGREMARHADTAAVCGIDVYFAEPHSPWQRPTNENGNGLLRRYLGKGTDLNQFTNGDLRVIAHRLNTMPRRVLGWSTAQAVYHHAVALIT